MEALTDIIACLTSLVSSIQSKAASSTKCPYSPCVTEHQIHKPLNANNDACILYVYVVFPYSTGHNHNFMFNIEN